MYELGLALISRSLIFLFGISKWEVEKRSTPILPYKLKPSGLESTFFYLWKKVETKAIPYYNQKFLHSRTPCIA